MRAAIAAATLVLASAGAHADEAPPAKDGPGMYIGVSVRVGRTEDVFGAQTLKVIGLATGARYRYRCLEAGLGITLDWMQTSRRGAVLGGEAFVLRDLSERWALGGRISAGRGEATDHEATVGDGFVGMAGVRARYRDVLSFSVDGYTIRGHGDDHAEGLLIGAGVTGDLFKYGYVTGAIGLVLAAGVIVFAPPPPPPH